MSLMIIWAVISCADVVRLKLDFISDLRSSDGDNKHWLLSCKSPISVLLKESYNAKSAQCMLEVLLWMQGTFGMSKTWPSLPSSSSSNLLRLMGASLFCSHLTHCSCQHIQILGGTLNPLFHLTLSSIHAWARPPSHTTDTPASMINSPLLGLSIHSAHCWEPLKQDNSCIPSSHWA